MAGQAQPSGTPRSFRLLLDSNVLFSVEPFAGQLEDRLPEAAALLRAASAQGHRVLVHPASLDDARTDTDPVRRTQRLAELGKYEQIAEVPVPSQLQVIFGHPQAGTRDHRDMRILAALPAHAVTHLITDDERLRRRARRAGLGDAVLSVLDAKDLLADLVRPAGEAPPRVRVMQTYELDVEQPIFDSLRDEYRATGGRAGFDEWLDKVRADHTNRLAFAVEDGSTYQAVAIVKFVEDDPRYGVPPGTSKIATFKVDPDSGGSKLGELLLKAVLYDAAARESAGLFVEVYPHHTRLVALLEEFGFADTGLGTASGEVVLHKSRRPDPSVTLDDLEFHIAYGPPALRITTARLVPIEPKWFDQLFPDSPVSRSAPATLPMFGDVETRPWGNALRKAYVSFRVHRSVSRGDTLLFYRSKDLQAVAAVGVVEATCISADPDELITFMGQRTVYSPEEIESFCRRGGDVTAMIFRQDRFVEPPWARELLDQHGVVRGWPQTIAQVPQEGVAWLRTRLA